jgi:oxaloacetate decarboxylase alpha subunit
MFAQVGWKFLVNRNNPDAFEAGPNPEQVAPPTQSLKASKAGSPGIESYAVNVDGRNFNVTVGPGGGTMAVHPLTAEPIHGMALSHSGSVVYAPMAGNILKILVTVGSAVAEGDVVIIMEAMKMETEVRSKFAGIVSAVHIKEGGAVAGGNALISL